KTAKPPRTADGKPNFQGFWGRNDALSVTVLNNPRNTVVIDPPSKIPYQPWAEAKQKELSKDYIDAAARCMPFGPPRHFLAPLAYRIMQTPGYVLFISEVGH